MPEFTIFALHPVRGIGPYVAAVLEGAVDSVDEADTTPGYSRLAETVTAHSALEAEIIFLLDHAAMGVEHRFPGELQVRDAFVHGEHEVQVIDRIEHTSGGIVLHFEDGSARAFDPCVEVDAVTIYRERKHKA